ncbi:hypothetical protein T484DRAFT_1815969 [Baffinella frigidus]|nr:hypothetical protein T484DRAFT_1815969 [Cryptophyta sp. CCMP2293]
MTRAMKHGDHGRLPRLERRRELRDHFPLKTDRASVCSTGPTLVADAKSYSDRRDAHHVSWDIYEYVLTISRTPSLQSCASPEPEEPATSAALLYLALRGSPLDALRGELQFYTARSGSLDSKGRRMDTAPTPRKLHQAYGADDAFFARGESTLMNRADDGA